MSWWQGFFDDDYLRLWSRALTPERTEQEAAAIPKMLGLPPGSSVLDVPCGQGRLSMPLARSGYRVTGVDYSLDLLKHVTGVQVVRADMRRLPLTGPFDAVINIFTSIGFFDDDRGDAEAIAEFARVLRPGGVLLLELNHRDVVIRNFVERTWFEMDGGTVLVERKFDSLRGISNERLCWEENGEPRSKEFRCRVYAASEIATMLAVAGLRVVQTWGGFDLSPFTRQSPRLAVLARRPE